MRSFIEYIFIIYIVHIRLVDGIYKTWRNTTRDGRVEILSNEQWGTICDVGFDKQDADVICKQLGFPGSYTCSYVDNLNILYGHVGDIEITIKVTVCEFVYYS